MSHKEELIRLAEQHGYALRDDSTENFISLKGVHCLLTDEANYLVPGRCTITVYVDSGTRTKITPPDDGRDCDHCVAVTLDRVSNDGLVYDANGHMIGGLISSDNQRRSVLSINPGSQSNPKAYSSPYHCLLTYTKHICGPGMSPGQTTQATSQPNFQEIFEHRAGVQPMQNKVRGHSVAIFGLGGTGSYILDFIVKTSIARIHIFDDDKLEQHNIMRAPGAPNDSQLDNIGASTVYKVDYYKNMYRAMGKGIIPYQHRADADQIRRLVEKEKIHFAFIAVDQLTEHEHPRQDELYTTLEDLGVNYIDVGMNVARECDKIHASLNVFVGTESNRGLWKDSIPNSKLVGEVGNLYENSQICELNALNAALAIVEWRKATGQYQVDGEKKYQLKYKTGLSKIIT